MENGMPAPHDALQAYLNVQPDRWGLVTNGLYLRILRDYHHTYTKGYIEFDLEAIFLTRSFSDFQALYRLAHASRFIPSDTGELYLEEYFKHSRAVGEKIGRDLRQNVVQAITALGNGFLDAEMLAELKGNDANCHRYYQELLKIIYRIIFLLYAEQRGMIGGSGSNCGLYLEEYSLSALRERATRYAGQDDNHMDYWIGLKKTFRMVRRGSDEMGIYPYNGMLFETIEGEYLSRRNCRNSELLKAIRYLTLAEIEGTVRRISYSDIDVEEIGSIYESLLDYTPRVTEGPEEIEGKSYPANSFILDPRGSTRKTTGSYYTHPDLIQELIKSALIPVLEDRLRSAGMDKERAILSIKVCDPACGSGAFLIAACNRLALELAKVRSDSDVPEDDLLREARRDVLQSCIYGVDLNPMAVELAKVSLWINAMVKDKPLNFLDHHIKCGNSLIGATPELIAQGVPEGAFDIVSGDDKKVAKYFKDINKKQLKAKGFTLDKWAGKDQPGYAEEFDRLSAMKEDSVESVVDKCRAYHKLKDVEELRRKKREADTWTAAFFMPLSSERALVPTTLDVQRQGSEESENDLTRRIEEVANKYRFFHWHLEFPEVFADGGFDVVLGNPPWERIKLQEKEFFAARDLEVANAPTAAARKKFIQRLKETNPRMAAEYSEALHDSEAKSKFIRSSGRFPLTGAGDINTYAVFAELARNFINPKGRAGIVVPSGIATDYTYKDFFRELMDGQSLASLYDFENREGLFQGTHRSYKFCLLTMAGGGIPAAEFAFFLHNVRELQDPVRRIALSKEDLALINPNTRTCPIFRTRRDAELARKLYRAAPVLVNDRTNQNPWRISLTTMFHSGGASGLFRSYEELKDKGLELKTGNRLVGNETYLPLYEGKMFMQYDHRASQVEVNLDNISRAAVADDSSIEQKTDPNYSPMPRFWVDLDKVKSVIQIDTNYFITVKKVTSPTNEHTLLAAILPYVSANDSIHLIQFDETVSNQLRAAFLANLNSFVLDFISRQKLGGLNFNFWVMQQLPILPPGHNLVSK
jgi:type I restriction-modification system DNA methylase subunit